MVQLVDGCCALKRRSADHESEAVRGIQSSFYSRSAARHLLQVKKSLARKPRLIEGFESETEGFNYGNFVDALEEDASYALSVVEMTSFKEKYALGAILWAISGVKEQAFMTLVAAMKPLNRFEINLEHFIKALDGWNRNEILKRMLFVIQEECGGKMDETSSKLESSFTKSYLLGLTTFSRLREVQNAYAIKGQYLSLTEALVRAITFNNLLLLRDVLDHNQFNVNCLFSLPEHLGSAFDNAFHKYDKQIRKIVGKSKITPLMFAFILGRGAAAEMIASRPETQITLETHKGLNLLEIYQRLRPHDKSIVHSALQLRNEVDLEKVEAAIKKFKDKSLATAILNDRPDDFLEAFLWKGLSSFSLGTVLAAVYKRNFSLLKKFVDMGWLNFQGLDEAIKSLIFETLLLVPPREMFGTVSKLCNLGFDLKFGGCVIDGMYVPKVLDYYLTKRMTHAHLKNWIFLYMDQDLLPKLPALRMDLIIFTALKNFDEGLLSWIVENYPETLTSYVSPIYSEPLMFAVLRTYYPVTRDLKFVNLLAIELKPKLTDTCTTFKEIKQPASYYSNYYEDGFWISALTKTALLTSPASYYGVHYHDVRTISKGSRCSIADLIWAVQDAEELYELFEVKPRDVKFKELPIFRTAGIGSSARLNLDKADLEFADWAFYASLVKKGFPEVCGFRKECVEDNYAIGPEGNSVFHIIVSPRAAHNEINKLVELIEYFGKTREFYVDFVAIEGENITYKNDEGEQMSNSTKGWTAFMIAVARRKYELANALAECGANIYATTNDGLCFARDYICRLCY